MNNLFKTYLQLISTKVDSFFNAPVNHICDMDYIKPFVEPIDKAVGNMVKEGLDSLVHTLDPFGFFTEISNSNFWSSPFTPLSEKFVFNGIAATIDSLPSASYHVCTSLPVFVGVFTFIAVTLPFHWPTYVGLVYTLKKGYYVLKWLPWVWGDAYISYCDITGALKYNLGWKFLFVDRGFIFADLRYLTRMVPGEESMINVGLVPWDILNDIIGNLPVFQFECFFDAWQFGLDCGLASAMFTFIAMNI